MSTAPQLRATRERSREETTFWVLLLAFGLAAFGPGAVFGAALLGVRLRESTGLRGKLGTAILGITGGLLSLWAWGPVTAAVEPQFLAWWLLALPFIPMLGLLWHMGEWLMKYVRQPTLQELLAAERRWEAAREEAAARRALDRTGKVPGKGGQRLLLGPLVRGDAFPRESGIDSGGAWLGFSEGLLDQHLFILGSTGAGKSETLKRLAHEILTKTERDLIVVDGKGDPELDEAMRALAYADCGVEAPVFRLGTGKPGAAYDGFRGEAQDVYSRLAAMVGVEEAEGNAQYYADMNRDLLQLICYAPSGPPRSFEELRGRLSLKWLLRAWRDDPAELETIRGFKPEDLSGLARRLRPLIREFVPLVGPEGFALEEARVAVFSLRAQSVGDTARRFLRFLIEDVKDFAGKRQRRPAVLIIDEFGVFSNRSIIDLLRLARSAKLGIVLATQDAADLGERLEAQQLLANTRTKLLMATDHPEEIAKLAGTIWQVEAGLQIEEGQATGLGTARFQHAFRIDMNDPARLKAGEGWLIRQRYAAKLRVASVETPQAPPERAMQPRSPRRSVSPTAEKAAAGGEPESEPEGVEL